MLRNLVISRSPNQYKIAVKWKKILRKGKISVSTQDKLIMCKYTWLIDDRLTN
jgi:hypothetical protein